MPDRLLRESIRISESINQLSAFAETFFYRLMVSVDDDGYIDARPRVLSRTLYPLKDVRDSQISDTLHQLSSAGLITPFKKDGKLFVRLTNWDRYQDTHCETSKEQKKSKPSTKLMSDAMQKRFDRFWQAYPKKTGKGKAEESFAKYKPDDELTDRMIKAVEALKDTEQWKRDAGKYIPYPATWLNQKRWEDEIPDEADRDEASLASRGLEDWDR